MISVPTSVSKITDEMELEKINEFISALYLETIFAFYVHLDERAIHQSAEPRLQSVIHEYNLRRILSSIGTIPSEVIQVVVVSIASRWA